MPSNAIHLDTSLAWAKGGYTVQVALGSRRAPAKLVLDTGSSTLAVSPAANAPEYDAAGAPFRQADGSFGLAYRTLDPAHDINALLLQRAVMHLGLRVGDGPVAPAPPLSATHGESHGSNALPDTGNALKAGRALFLLMPGLAHFPRQSILGLPLFAGRYAVFDRRAGGLGSVRLAQARLP